MTGSGLGGDEGRDARRKLEHDPEKWKPLFSTEKGKVKREK